MRSGRLLSHYRARNKIRQTLRLRSTNLTVASEKLILDLTNLLRTIIPFQTQHNRRKITVQHDSETPLNAEWSTDDQNSIRDDPPHKRDEDAFVRNLENWHGLEIDGEAIALPSEGAVEESAAFVAETQTSATARINPIRDRIDDAIIATIDLRAQIVEAGATARYSVTVLNNGERRGLFDLHTEGWVNEEWVTISPQHTRLQPGESAIFDVAITPPRLPASTAGERPFALIVRSPDEPKRRTQLGALLTIQPYTAFTLAELRPSKLDTSWYNRSATTTLPITNHSNVAAQILLAGQDRDQNCRFDFATPQSSNSYANYHGAAYPERPVLTLQPGQTQYVPVRITPDAPTLFGLQRDRTSFRITGWITQAHTTSSAQAFTNPEATTARMAHGRLTRTPLVGPGMMSMLASCILVLSLSVGAIGLFTLLALYPTGLRRLAPPTTIVESAPAPVEIVVKISEPVPTSAGGLEPVAQNNGRIGTGGAAVLPVVVPSISAPLADGAANQTATNQSGTAQEAAPEIIQQVPTIPQQRAPQSGDGIGDGIVLVQPNMISQPGEVAPVQLQPIQVQPAQIAPVAAAPSANAATMTYEQLFRTVGAQYEIDWRILAAQAYVESSFNPLALGSKGDLGLMQVLPSTWKEWAPRVDVADPFDTYSNVVVAAAYLDYVRNTFASQGYTDAEWMLVAYNWGPNQLRGFLNEGNKWDDLAPARQKYARDILRIAESLQVN